MLSKSVGSPGSEKSVPLMCSKCKNPIRKKKGKSTRAVSAVCKKCLLKG